MSEDHEEMLTERDALEGWRHWLASDSSAHDRTGLAARDILMIPQVGHFGHAGPVFPEGALDLFDAVRDSAGSRADMCVADPDYAEKHLRSADKFVELGIWLVTNVGAPLLVAGLLTYISRRSGPKDPEVRVELTIDERTRGGKRKGEERTAKRFVYRGPASLLQRTIARALRQFNNEHEEP